ncbi:MAG: sulfatase-like hydrolase/transferase [Planctomycetota bacterium]|nr:sulfatase-like hydrolase/transferase [Planctomycetota bacterium]
MGRREPRRRFLKLAGAVGLGAVMSGWARAADNGKRPNVVLIMTDQQSADAMSCHMGKWLINTPVMDRLAADGMVLRRAYSANPLCQPQRNSMFTGMYPHQTGVTSNVGKAVSLDTKEFVCLGTCFRDAGYETAYSGKWHLQYDLNDSRAHGFEILRSRINDNLDARTADAAVKFLARKHDGPFLLVASFTNPHNICEWARRLAGRKDELSCGEIGAPPALDQLPPMPGNFALPRNEPDGMTVMRKGYHYEGGLFPVGKFTEADWRKQRWGYYRMIEKVDAEIGKVLEALRHTGQTDKTLIIFTSDHGECAGAHHFNQKTVFYEESVRVPLIVVWKGRVAAGTSDKLVNTGIDVFPTLLEAAGIGLPRKLPGQSLLPLALNRSPAAWRDHVVVQNNMTQTGPVDELGFAPTMEGRMVRTERHKYCVYSRGVRRESLVDLDADPGETNDLAGDGGYREVLLAHRRLLAQFGQTHKDPLVAELLADDIKPMSFTAADGLKAKKPRTAGGE